MIFNNVQEEEVVSKLWANLKFDGGHTNTDVLNKYEIEITYII